MAKRNNVLFKKTAVEPEVVDSVQGEEERYIPVVYDGPGDSPPDFVKPLTSFEQKRRKELEGIIYKNFKAYYDVGCALREIQHHMLYRSTHDRFSDYLKELWDMARSQAFRLIDAANTVDNLIEFISNNDGSKEAKSRVPNWGHGELMPQNVSPIGGQKSTPHEQDFPLIPQNERQARALTKFDPKQQRVIWLEAVESAPNGKISAAHIKKTAKRLHLEKVRDTITKTKKKAVKTPKINPAFLQAYTNFLDAINDERRDGFKNTDRDEVIRHVRIVLDVLEADL